MDHTLLSIFFFFSFLGISRPGVNTKDAMKKQIRRIHSVFSHVDPWPFSFFRRSSKNFKHCIAWNSYVVWRSRPFTKRCAGERVWNHALHRVVTRSSVPATCEYHYRTCRPLANMVYGMLKSLHSGVEAALIDIHCGRGNYTNHQWFAGMKFCRVTTRCIAWFQTLSPAQRLVKGRLRQTNSYGLYCSRHFLKRWLGNEWKSGHCV